MFTNVPGSVNGAHSALNTVGNPVMAKFKGLSHAEVRPLLVTLFEYNLTFVGYNHQRVFDGSYVGEDRS